MISYDFDIRIRGKLPKFRGFFVYNENSAPFYGIAKLSTANFCSLFFTVHQCRNYIKYIFKKKN